MTAINVASAFRQLHMRKADSEWLEHSQIVKNKTKSLPSIGEGLLKSAVACPHDRMLGRF